MPSLLYAGENDSIVIYDRGARGDLERRPEPVPLPRPMRSLSFAPDRYHLYVATNGDPDDATKPPLLLTFAVDQATGALAPMGEGVPMPKVPAYVATDRSGRWLLAAAYHEPGHWSVIRSTEPDCIWRLAEQCWCHDVAVVCCQSARTAAWLVHLCASTTIYGTHLTSAN
eukprot:SAG11_NODE_12275_length_711_cov_1.606209_1_plen_169_part_01